MTLITGGGTGGHLSIAKALCEAYNALEKRPYYIGSTNGQDRAWFEGYPGFKNTFFLPTKGVVNQRGLGKLFSLGAIIKQVFTCRALLRQHGITRVISVGGYAAAPAALAALSLKIPLYIHEQNAAIGRLNSVLRPFAKTFFSSYDSASSLKDYPVATRFFEAYRPRNSLNTLLFLGGSQGARFINALARAIAPALSKQGVRIIHQCGKSELTSLQIFYAEQGIEVDVFDFSDALHVKLHEADVAIARAGAGSVWELCAAGIPTLFIPFPHAASDHQYYNAKAFADQGLAGVLRQEEATPEAVLAWLQDLSIEQINQSLPQQLSKGGAQAIVAQIERT
ncbi:MAG: UDP-N-acetylglucosamine--N-acetylmuramyl-(pentapeptide) pyrophosphoryl-undecaprenol N-acetylglucosamine transferase [Campylobacterales bacterium]|nr:UDP-N-acetylglucosamine--N-acetylmuramyl-(pentapeptide) pyrophosphoryl-undecaprenol N-acetylglucosamine transferase [Campylobacterales bacterium]